MTINRGREVWLKEHYAADLLVREFVGSFEEWLEAQRIPPLDGRNVPFSYKFERPPDPNSMTKTTKNKMELLAKFRQDNADATPEEIQTHIDKGASIGLAWGVPLLDIDKTIQLLHETPDSPEPIV